MARRLQATRQQRMLAERAEELTVKAKFAQGEGREDLAEAALSRQIDFEAQAKKLDAVSSSRRARGRAAARGWPRRAQRTQASDGRCLAAYLISRREAALGGDGPARPERSAEKKVDAAEQALIAPWLGLAALASARADADTGQPRRRDRGPAEERHRRRAAGRV